MTPAADGGAPLQGSLCLRASRASPRGPPVGPPARGPRSWRVSPRPPRAGARTPAAPPARPGVAPPAPARTARGTQNHGAANRGGPRWGLLRGTPGRTWGRRLPRGPGARAAAWTWACVGRGGRPPFAASPPPPTGQGEGPLTSVAAGGEVARCEQQHGRQRQHLGAPHAEVVVDLPLAQVVGQSRHLGSSMTTVRGGAGKGRRTGAALGPSPPQPGEKPPPVPAATTRASSRGA